MCIGQSMAGHGRIRGKLSNVVSVACLLLKVTNHEAKLLKESTTLGAAATDQDLCFSF